MKIYISADMEGIAGIVHGDQTEEGAEFMQSRKLMTEEVNATIRGAFSGGATEVLVNDSHNTMRNIIIEDLDPRASLISGNKKPLSMMEGVDMGFDGVILVGYHARAGAPGVISHTYSGIIRSLKINGYELGEAGLNGLVAGCFNVPLIMATGDDKLCEEVRAFFGEVETVAVKRYISRNAAQSRPLKEVYKDIEATAKKAVKGIKNFKSKRLEGPYAMEVAFQNIILTDMAAARIPGVKAIDSNTISFNSTEFLDVFKVFLNIS